PFCRCGGPGYIKSNIHGINSPSPRPAARPGGSTLLRAAASSYFPAERRIDNHRHPLTLITDGFLPS
ncbi:hypothetical protein F5883DRAFT_513221, partial [Diaporthe sp. PMI_573]